MLLGGLGFRDIHNFNVDMLSRQVWRLIQNLESLCARVLRARYYPDGNIMEAQARPCISYAWRSLLHGLDLVRQGYIWRIGSGSSVNIWRDPWIPRAWSRGVITPRNGNLLETVDELISPIDGKWDMQLVRDTFMPVDTHLILNIPLRDGMDDFMAWHYDSKGLHSVKMAYKLHAQLSGLNGDERGTSSSSGIGGLIAGDESFWKRIWRMACSSKIKMFVWRLAHDSLAVRANLSRKGMVLDDLRCPMCGHACARDSAHLFIKCKKVKEVWRALELECIRGRLEATASACEALDIIWGLPEQKRMEVFHFMWHWWNNRNKKRNGEKERLGQVIAHDARIDTAECLELWPKKKVRRNREDSK